MRYPPSILDDIRARLPVSAVVGRRVKLVKAGREWKGLSPFNAEKSPSFFVNDQKGFFHDFSSGKNGDIFKFLMETEGVSFPEAVERLAADAGVILPKLSVEAEEQEVRRTGLHQVMALAQEFFQAQLMAPPVQAPPAAATPAGPPAGAGFPRPASAPFPPASTPGPFSPPASTPVPAPDQN